MYQVFFQRNDGTITHVQNTDLTTLPLNEALTIAVSWAKFFAQIDMYKVVYVKSIAQANTVYYIDSNLCAQYNAQYK